MDGTTGLAWINRFMQLFTEEQDHLTDLDRRAGDGDFGTNIASALRRVALALPEPVDATVGSVFHATSRGFLATGGTSGPLFGMCFRQIARATESDLVTTAQLAQGVTAGLATVQQLGGARVGDNTMVDALAPAADALRAGADQDASAPVALNAAATAARAGAAATAHLVAARGRASYVGELARDVLDPGALTVALLFEAGAEVTMGGAHVRQPAPSSLRRA